MEHMTDDISNAFRSARLQYIRADKSDEHFKAFIPQVVQDPVTHALASSTMLAPQGIIHMDAYAASVVKSLLGVMVCLLPEEHRKEREKTTFDTGPVETDGETGRTFKEKPTIIGVVCIGWGGLSPSAAHHRTSSIGISLAKPYQNKGYGREAINWMLDWAFRHGGLHSVSICAASFNPKVAHLYESIGFVLEGRRRETIWFNRKWHDEIEFGMTEKEWELLRAIRSQECTVE